MPLDLVVSGATGRMGRALARLIHEADDLHALGGIAPDAGAPEPGGQDGPGYPEIVPMGDAGALVRRADAVIDFSAPPHVRALVEHLGAELEGRALLVGTTGLDPDTTDALRDLSKRVAVIVAPNFSVGINLLLGLVEQAARALPAADYDIEIVETHHGRKEDAPSGTALALGRAAAAGRGQELDDVRTDGRSGRTGARPSGEIGLHALRGGDVAGEHIVHFLGVRERIGLSHSAASRALFAEGALVAARWLAGRAPGWYGMRDVLGLSGAD